MNKRLLEHFYQMGLVDPNQVRAAMAQQQQAGGEVLDLLIDLKMVAERDIAKALSSFYRYPVVDLNEEVPQDNALSILDGDYATTHTILPLAVNHKSRKIRIATYDPSRTMEALDFVRRRSGWDPQPCITERTALRQAIRYYFFGQMPGSDPGADQGPAGLLKKRGRGPSPGAVNSGPPPGPAPGLAGGGRMRPAGGGGGFAGGGAGGGFAGGGFAGGGGGFNAPGNDPAAGGFRRVGRAGGSGFGSPSPRGFGNASPGNPFDSAMPFDEPEGHRPPSMDGGSGSGYAPVQSDSYNSAPAPGPFNPFSSSEGFAPANPAAKNLKSAKAAKPSAPSVAAAVGGGGVVPDMSPRLDKALGELEALKSRVAVFEEKLEHERRVVEVLTDILIDSGLVSRDELLKKLRQAN